MRPISMRNATKVLIAALAVILSFASFAEARDRTSERNHVRRPHFERSHGEHHHRGRQEAISGVTADRHYYRHDRRSRGDRGYRNDRRHDRFQFDWRTANRGHFEPRYGRDRHYDRSITVREYRGQGRNGWGQSYGDDGFPSEANGGTYFGGLSAWTDPGNGTYFSSERNGYGYYSTDTGMNYPAARPKIIRVNPSTAGRACSWESGVCVIRR
ncbi:hypothetical protein OE766_06750 [Pararhizobium sp. YC-54]|uniref:hypothetical protein n=1 Tax=Pararhizobium sp. YC-54 TaxID=2986920 RepID=UPI0021F7B002|nr:hypothetical protein [Pararhizobium sp. YC-54]MCV9997939.1 hypothetical protein [Pararhizobium sp. YC-54]